MSSAFLIPAYIPVIDQTCKDVGWMIALDLAETEARTANLNDDDRPYCVTWSVMTDMDVVLSSGYAHIAEVAIEGRGEQVRLESIRNRRRVLESEDIERLLPGLHRRADREWDYSRTDGGLGYMNGVRIADEAV